VPTTTSYAFANNVSTTIATAINSSVTTIPLASSANFPTIPAGFVWAVTINDRATQNIFEIVYVTATSGANLTVLRGQEGTTARAWSVGDYAFAADTAGILNSFVDQTYLTTTLASYATGLFNPRNYGALGNGTTNDAAAFTAANTAAASGAGQQLYVPPGNYLISTSVSITSPIIFAAGAILVMSGAATVTFTYTPQAGRYQIFGGTALTSAAVLMAAGFAGLDPLCIEWWGAIPNNGTTDCGPAFQRAGNAVVSLLGSTISAGNGNYLILTTVSFLGISNLVIAGAGAGATNLVFSGASGTQGFTCGGTSSGAPAHTITLRDCSVSINASGSLGGQILSLQFGSNAVIKNVITNCPSGSGAITAINGNNWTGCLIDGLATRGAFTAPIIMATCPDWTVVNGDFRADTTVSGSVVIIGTSSNNLTCANNRIYATGAAVWTNGIVPGNGSDYYRFSNNAISSTTVPYIVDTTQLNGYIDYQSGTWVPADLSGAALSLTVNSATYVKIGKEVTAQFDVTYPTTANGSNALISLPFLVTSGVIYSASIAYYSTTTSITGAYVGVGVTFIHAGNTVMTNAQMTAGRVIGTTTYQSSY